MSFEPGARPAGAMIPLCVPEVRGREWDYVKECLDTGWVSSVGSFVDRFEREFATRAGTKHAVATVNGTSALHVALRVAGVGENDEVIVSTLTFIAPVNAIRYAGAWPVLIDAEPVYGQMDPALVAAFLERECATASDGTLRNRTTGRAVKALLPVHILGHPCDMKPLLELARRYGLVVIEDATESLGAEYQLDDWRRVGSMGDISCFSFNGNKLITTGGGGMLCSNDPELAAKAKYLTTQAKDDPIEYVHHEIGYNYRLTNIQAAMGCAQLEQVDAFVAKKRAIQNAYEEGLRDVPGLRLLTAAPWARSACWMPTVLVNPSEYVRSSRELLRHLQAEHIQTRPLWTPIHLNKPYAHTMRLGGSVAEQLHAEALSLPCSVGLDDAAQQRVIATLRAGALA